MSRNLLRTLMFLLLASAVSACGSAPSPGNRAGGGPHIAGITCAPFARELSGVALYGDAAEWWDAASGRYRRSSDPDIGSVLVLRREGRLPSGHVSVVSRVIGRRQIEVIQANWVPSELDVDQLVVDVSDENDWSRVRVWWPPVGQLGAHEYAAYGFIHAPASATHEQLARAAAGAARLSLTSMRGRPPPRARSYGG
jgi:surface antigen